MEDFDYFRLAEEAVLASIMASEVDPNLPLDIERHYAACRISSFSKLTLRVDQNKNYSVLAVKSMHVIVIPLSVGRARAGKAEGERRESRGDRNNVVNGKKVSILSKREVTCVPGSMTLVAVK